jgi:hypothetical protein
MKIDTRLFAYAGSSLHNGLYKARFANNLSIRIALLKKSGDTEIVMSKLPHAMSKTEAITYLKATTPPGVNIDALTAKEIYIAKQQEQIEKASLPKPVKSPKPAKVPGRKRGRPRKIAVIADVNTIAASSNSLTNSTSKMPSHVKLRSQEVTPELTTEVTE